MNNPDPATWARRLIDLLEQQKSMLDRLATLARRQSALIEKGEAEALLEVLAQRQELIDLFGNSQSEFTRLTKDMEARLTSVDAATADRIRGLTNTIGEQLAEVMQQDEKDRAALEHARNAARKELNSLGSAQKARQAYLAGQKGGARFADQQG